MKNHPTTTYIYLFITNALALIIAITAIINIGNYPIEMWITFVLWSGILSITKIGGLFEFMGIEASTGWSTSIVVASMLVLPFPLFCLSMIVSHVLVMAKLIYIKHSEPFLCPDLNVSNNILAAFASTFVYEKITFLLVSSVFITIIPLMLSVLIYGIINVILYTTFLSIHKKKTCSKVKTISTDSLITESILLMTGALIGRVYILDPFLITIMLLPLLMMHRLLSKMNEGKLVYIDEKTGLSNYRYFDEKLNELFYKSRTHNQPLALIFGDIDYLRNVNNTYGHPVGDLALITIAKIFKGNKPANAVAARFGGEEFVMLLPNYNKYHAAKIAEDMRRKIENTKIPLEDGTLLQVTMSFGVADFPNDAEDIEHLSKKSDQAVYEAKKLGRNRVEIYSKEVLKH